MNVKLVLFFCLSFILALPVQSQVPTDTPLSVPVPDCGLPTAPTTWTSSTTQKVWNLTANCEVPRWPGGNAYIRVHSGEFTINGNGYSIIGGGNNWVVMAQGNGTVLNLNNIAIRGDGFIAIGTPLTVRNGQDLTPATLSSETLSHSIRMMAESPPCGYPAQEQKPLLPMSSSSTTTPGSGGPNAEPLCRFGTPVQSP